MHGHSQAMSPVIVEIEEEKEKHDDPDKDPAEYEENAVDFVTDGAFPILHRQVLA